MYRPKKYFTFHTTRTSCTFLFSLFTRPTVELHFYLYCVLILYSVQNILLAMLILYIPFANFVTTLLFVSSLLCFFTSSVQKLLYLVFIICSRLVFVCVNSTSSSIIITITYQLSLNTILFQILRLFLQYLVVFSYG